MVFKRQNLDRVAYCDPSNGHYGTRWKRRFEMDNSIDPHFGPHADPGPIKDRNPRREKYIVFHRATRQMGMWSYKNVITKTGRMPRRAPDHRMFHNDAVRTDLHKSSLSHDHCPEEKPAVLTNGDVSTDHCCRGDIG
jgi:hypothetical protein